MTLKKNSPIPDDNHIARHIPWNKLRKDMDDNVLGVLGEAFKLKPKEKYLSATLLEYFPGTYTDQIESVVREVRKYYHVKPKSHFAIGKVEDIHTLCQEKRKLKLRIVSFPTTTKLLADGASYKNESHVSVKQLPQDDMELLEFLATDVWNYLVLNSSISP
ncbi:conserved hypothetical protein [Bathymodiolus platifrons methanotrophic gill symbiont]|nr:hypothetical protein BMR11_16935 [Methylococcaceae bacterium CS5]TXK95390.1 hypothetical protein BMR02_12840 [Methylococcaceae bacterium HT1]TXL14399.1 hypothetical protein BMR04_13340 [Methylococcaceae bacterium HT3]TXL18545.1 hypothetical protein BMR06_13505 [Methylococcaceae bacterium HT5]TXL19610.1 hypothetical protein BMR03_15065 [Methylococcaceae bacterium HT2]GAW87326.1 conserved hypothetical protein [Bathymodiolus platifrons methanotrophic gill symbiont]GFO73502.1 hypothetical prot